MPDRSTLRIGSAAAIVGGVLALVTNLLHPRLSEFDDYVPAELRMVADSGAWIPVHLGLLLGTLLISAGLYVATRTLADRGVDGLRRLAVGSLLVGTAVAVVTLVIDGYATKAVADAWAAAQDDVTLAAGTAVAELGWAAFMGLVIVYLGTTPVLIGWAVARSRLYPAAFGWPVVILGLLAMVSGVMGVLDGPSAAFFLLFTISSGLLTLWVIGIGIVLWRRVADAVPAAAAA
ncbi:MAG: hypothetical protein ACRDH8_10675 [Actinomycetota bacterium]